MTEEPRLRQPVAVEGLLKEVTSGVRWDDGSCRLLEVLMGWKDPVWE